LKKWISSGDKMKRVLLIFALIICSLVVDIGFCKEGAPKVIKVKGMYIGMDINDARAILQNHFNDNIEIKNGEGIYSGSYSITDHQNFVILSSPNGKVNYIAFLEDAVNSLFNAHGYSLEEFKESFFKAYNLPEPKKEFYGWDLKCYNDLYIQISNGKSLIIQGCDKKG
jgi:hypothetical protein